MGIYIFLVAAILALNFVRKSGQISDKAFCIVVGTLFILITGLRHNDVGSDTTGYYFSFYSLEGYSLSQVIAWGKRDFGYYIFTWLICKVFHNFAALTLIAACAFYIPISKLIYKYSEDCGLSYLVLMAFTFFQFSMTGIRQTIALGFSVLFLLEILEEKPKYIRAAIWMYIGITMHRSSIAVLLMLLVRAFRSRKEIAWACVMLLPFVFLFRTRLTGLAMGLFNAVGFNLMGYFGNSGGLTTLAVYVALLLYGLIFTYSEEEDGMPTMFLIIMGVIVLLQVFVSVNSILFRVVWYFSIFIIIYIPKMIYSSRGRNGSIVNLVVYIGILFMYFGITMGTATVLPYKFFWQG